MNFSGYLFVFGKIIFVSLFLILLLNCFLVKWKFKLRKLFIFEKNGIIKIRLNRYEFVCGN